MAPEDAKLKLEALRTKILKDLSSMADQLADNDDVSLEALMAVAQSTGNIGLLEKALQKAQSVDNPNDKADALLGLLDEVENQLTIDASPDNNDQVETQSIQGANLQDIPDSQPANLEPAPPS